MSKNITIGISDLNVTKAPDVLVTYALGSCVGICLYDAKITVAGLSHIMLPNSKDIAGSTSNKHKFADTAIVELIELMERQGCMRRRIVAKIAGGAQMFAGSSGSFNIGERNVAAVKQILASLSIPIVAQETGANFGRTVFFNAATGIMEVRAATRETKYL